MWLLSCETHVSMLYYPSSVGQSLYPISERAHALRMCVLKWGPPECCQEWGIITTHKPHSVLCVLEHTVLIKVTIIYIFYFSTFPSKYNWYASFGREKRNHRFFKIRKLPVLVPVHSTDESAARWRDYKRNWRKQTWCDFSWMPF